MSIKDIIAIICVAASITLFLFISVYTFTDLYICRDDKKKKKKEKKNNMKIVRIRKSDRYIFFYLENRVNKNIKATLVYNTIFKYFTDTSIIDSKDLIPILNECKKYIKEIGV